MNQIAPSQHLAGVIKPFYPHPKGTGRRSIRIERMRRFAGIDLGREPVPDETSI